MSVSSRAVSVTTTATRLDVLTDTDDGSVGQALAVYNASAVTVYIGGANVTTANGVPIAATSWGPGLGLGVADAIYGIVAADTAEVRVLEVGV